MAWWSTAAFGLRAMALQRVAAQPRAEIMKIQERRLRRLLRHAVSHSSFFRDKYRHLDVDTASLTDFPTLTKQELMAHFNEAVTDPRLKKEQVEAFVYDRSNLGKYYLDQYVISHTSGSQGQPLLIIEQREDVELLFALQASRGNERYLGIREAIRSRLNPARLAVVTLKRGFYPSACAFEYMPQEARNLINVLRLSDTDDDVIARLQEFRPTHVTAYAGVLSRLADEAEAGRLVLNPELRQITNNSERLSERLRERLDRVFGVTILDNYASGECPFLSNGCPTHPGTHVNADWVVFEVVDDAGRAVPDGEAGAKVLVTNLCNLVQPIIRYEIGDVVTMATNRCGCGSQMPRIERIDGRAADAFLVGNPEKPKRLSAILFQHAFEYLLEVREWQAEQISPGVIEIRVEMLPDATLDEDAARRAIDRELEEYGFRELVKYTVRVVPEIPPDPKTHKVRRTMIRND